MSREEKVRKWMESEKGSDFPRNFLSLHHTKEKVGAFVRSFDVNSVVRVSYSYCLIYTLYRSELHTQLPILYNELIRSIF